MLPLSFPLFLVKLFDVLPTAIRVHGKRETIRAKFVA